MFKGFSPFFQLNFKINLEEIKDFLHTIIIYLLIPDHEDYEGTVLCNPVRLIVHEQGPRVEWDVIAKIRQNYQQVLEFLLLPTQFYQIFRKLHVELRYNEPYFNPFFTPSFHVTHVTTEGYTFFDSADDYYRTIGLLQLVKKHAHFFK